MGKLSGKIGLVMGVANERSLAWAISKALYAEGAELAFTHLPSSSHHRRVKRLLTPYSPKLVLPCDVENDEDISSVFRTVGKTYGRIDMLVHSIAFAPPAELKRPYIQVSREGFHRAMDISVYSFVAVSRAASAWMPTGGSILTITYFGAEKVMPGYNLMGICKAALEHSVRYLAWDLGREKHIRVNALSAGPIRTLSSAGLPEFEQMLEHVAKKACLKRNILWEEIGAAGVFLLSEASSGITGEVLHVDAGYNIVGL